MESRKRRLIDTALQGVGDVHADAVGAVRPPRAIDLEGLLSVAYAIRSRSVHSLVDLPAEAWVFSDGPTPSSCPAANRC
jgi:hypothetical protein